VGDSKDNSTSSKEYRMTVFRCRQQLVSSGTVFYRTSDFNAACLILDRTVSSLFASIEFNRQKRRIGAIDTRSGGNCGGRGARGRGGAGRGTNRPMRVVMNGVDVTDISRNFTSDEWEKLCACGGHTYVTQRHKCIIGRHHGGSRGDNCGGRNDHASKVGKMKSPIRYEENNFFIAKYFLLFS
jgi:hypothetical protein